MIIFLFAAVCCVLKDQRSSLSLVYTVFDNLEDGSEPWHVCRSGWCANQFDHMSVTLVNHQLQTLYNYGVGFVLSPATEFVCGYTADGGTQGREMGGCNERPRCSSSHWWECGWRPDQLREAIETQLAQNAGGYNEYIISTAYWEANLPSIIEAVMCRSDCDRARQVHAAYLQAYGLTAEQCPLVYYEYNVGFRQL